MKLTIADKKIFGRTYVKHVSKGKNQTMAKISADGIKNFLLPLPKIEKQRQIVERIKDEMDKQKAIDLEIAQKRKEIDGLVMRAIGDGCQG